MMKELVSLEKRFFGLVAAILCVAVAVTSIAVWQSATPFLVKVQTDAVADHAHRSAADLDRTFFEHRQFLDYTASFPGVIALAVGNVTEPEAVADYLASREFPDPFLRVEIFDVLEDRLLSYTVPGPGTAMFTDGYFMTVAAELLNNEAPDFDALSFATNGKNVHFLFSVPIYYNRAIEGVLIAEVVHPQEGLLPESDLISAYAIAQAVLDPNRADKGERPTLFPIGETGLALHVEANEAAAFAAGQDMIETVVLSVAIVLIVPFGLFALIGRNALIRPHAELRKSERLLQQQKKDMSELAAVAQNANDAIIVTDLDARIRWVNPSFERLSGRRADAVIGRVPGDFLQGPATDPKITAEISKALRMRRPINRDLVNYTSRGTPYWISLSISPLFNDTDEVYGFMAITRDITEERQQRDALLAAKSEIETQALRDPLTDLPNRRALDLAIAERMRDTISDVTIIRIDLDRFKYVNDTLGHEAGDHALQQTARILDNETRVTDLVARIGGDEFVILLSPGSTVEIGVEICERLQAQIREPMTFHGKVLQIGASFGIASSHGNIIDRGEVSVSADSALYLAKDRGRNRIEVYAPSLHSEVVEKRNLAKEIRVGIRERGFVPYFQPQVDATTFEITGAETLARWQNPDRGLLAPGIFLPVAQQLSVIEEIDEIVFESALRALSRLDEHGLSLPKVSFNVTAQRLTDPSILAIMKRLAPTGTTIAFEILESVLLEEKSSDFDFHIDLMREAGIEIEIDDFGSGHASIIGLLKSAPDTMKIDQRLIAPLPESQAYRQMVRSIVQIGKSQSIKVIAEGVETYEHATILRDLGVDHLQGYYFARPMPERDLIRFLAEPRDYTQPETLRSSA